MEKTRLNRLWRIVYASLEGDTNLAPYVKRLTFDLTTLFAKDPSCKNQNTGLHYITLNTKNPRYRCDPNFSQLDGTEVCYALTNLGNLRSVHATTDPSLPRDYKSTIMIDSTPETMFLLAMRTLINVENPLTELKVTTGQNPRLSACIFSRSLDVHYNYEPTFAMTNAARQLCFKNDVGLALHALRQLRTLEIVLYTFKNGISYGPVNIGWLTNLLEGITPRVKHLVFDFITPDPPATDRVTVDVCYHHEQNYGQTGHSGITSSDLKLDKTYPFLESLKVKNVTFCTDKFIDFVRRHAKTLESLAIATWSCHDDLPDRSIMERVAAGLGHDLLPRITFSQEFNTLGRPCHYRRHFPKLRSLPCRYWKVNASLLWFLYSQAGLTEEAALLALSYEVDGPSDAEDAGPKHVEDVRKAQKEHEQALRGKDWSEIAEIGRKQEIDAIAARRDKSRGSTRLRA